VVMYKGEIVENGTAQQVLKQPKHAYTQALLQCRPGNHPPKTLLPTVSDFLNPNAENTALKNSFKALAPSQDVLLTLKNLEVEFGGQKKLFGKSMPPYKAVNKVSFEIFKGEIVGLVGESGCGKTTIGRTIMGLNKLTNGSIIWNGDNKHDNNKSLRWQMVFQDPFAALNPKLNIGNTIGEAVHVNKLGSRKEALEIAKSWLQKVNLDPEHISRYPHEFSGGQRQRIVISRALALSPQFIICDESVSALDVSVQSQILNILLKLKNELGFSILFISHDMAVIQHICDRVLVMRKGEIVEQGNAQEVYNNPKDAYTKGLIEAIPKGA
jgi:peptide/nickel transport system ATP-binding protein